MSINKLSIYWIIGSATLILIIVISWLLGAFENENQDRILIQTNQIINSQSLPTICQDVMSLMNCLITQTTWWQNSLQQSYQQLLSERNIITDTVRLESTCSQHYSHLMSLQDTWYTALIESCRSL